MDELGVEQDIVTEFQKRSFIMVNIYSDIDNRRKLDDAKERVADYLCYLSKVDDVRENPDLLEDILHQFYLYLEVLYEKIPHEKAGIRKETLQALKITNEYDIQFLLYAYLKPIFPSARLEVGEDTGYENVRTDIKINQNTCVEVKCSRRNMTKKKLIEEIEADMVHYNEENIYFYIYDKEKIIENASVFTETYENRLSGKRIHIEIVQPRYL